jgi:hypothetical protein
MLCERAGRMIALAGDLNFLRPCVAAGLAAVLLAGRYGAKTRLVGALFLFVCHGKFSFDYVEGCG